METKLAYLVLKLFSASINKRIKLYLLLQYILTLFYCIFYMNTFR